MMAPKSVQTNNSTMSDSIKEGKLQVMRDYLWNDKVSAEDANKVIDAFNAKWIAAGGISANSIVRKS